MENVVIEELKQHKVGFRVKGESVEVVSVKLERSFVWLDPIRHVGIVRVDLPEAVRLNVLEPEERGLAFEDVSVSQNHGPPH